MQKLQPFQLRVINERDELKVKVDSLKKFLDADTFENLDNDNKTLLREQFYFMDKYLSTLNKRISLF